MKNGFLRLLVCLLGALLAMGFVSMIFGFVPDTVPFWLQLVIAAAVLALSVLVFFLTSGVIVRGIAGAARKLDNVLSRVQMGDLCFGSIGAALGIWVASMLSGLLRELPYPLYLALSVILYLFISFLFGNTAYKRWRELPFFAESKKNDRSLGQWRASMQRNLDPAALPGYKLLDSSALIDGRILAVCKTGFLEGTLIAPQFVLEELQTLSDSADPEKRRKGRRALEVLEQIRALPQVTLIAGQYEDASDKDCDVKLLQLAKRLDASIITTDYNLCKVAQVSELKVLNLNELSAALMKMPMQGDFLRVQVIKPGRENAQGVGYLEDGTMIVVENGRSVIGQTVDTVVTSVLQTAAGRMVFARISEES